MVDASLEQFLAAGSEFDPYYGSALLSDHLPMALLSLRRLGATDVELAAFRQRYVTRLEPQRFSVIPLPADAWLGARGRRHFYPALRQYFQQLLANDGTESVLRRWIPRLIGSAGIDAFHPLIRTALAVESQSAAELSCGLAYWVSAWADLPFSRPKQRERMSISEAFAALRVHPEFGERPNNGAMFGEQLGRLAQMPAYGQLVNWRGEFCDLKSLAQEAARIYLSTQLFFSLHMVTGAQAAHALSAYVEDHEAFLDALWLSLAAAYIIIKTPGYSAFSPVMREPPPLNVVLAAALAHEDEHIAKLAFSAKTQWDCWRLPEHAEILHRIANRTARLGFSS